MPTGTPRRTPDPSPIQEILLKGICTFSMANRVLQYVECVRMVQAPIYPAGNPPLSTPNFHTSRRR